VAASVSFGTTELSKIFVVSTTNLNHTAPAYEFFTISGQDAAGAGASRVSSGVLNVLSQNVSSDHRFVITPSPQSVIEGSSVTFTISRAASGSAVTINLSTTSAGLVSPAFSASVVGSVSFGSTELSKIFVVSTTNLNHSAPAYEIFTISGQDASGLGASRVSSGVLNVLSQNVSSDHRFVITPSPQSVIEGDSVTFTISRAASGSAVTINLNVSSAGLVSPDFSASVAASVSFGTTELSKIFVVSTTNLNHTVPVYELFTISGQDAAGAGASRVSSSILNVLSQNVSSDHRFVITPSPQSVIEGGSVTFTISRAFSGSAVTINLSTTSAGLASSAFSASVVGSVSFGSTELSKVFVVSTTNLNHSAPVYEIFTISGQDASGLGASRVSSGVLNVLSQNVSSDHRFVITPSPQSVIEGDSITYTISRAASGSAVTINLSVTSAGLVSPDFAASVVGSVSFGTTELSKIFVVNTTNLNHTAPAYEAFTISGQDASGLGASRVSSGVLNVLSQNVSADHRFVITPSPQSVIEGGSVTYTISRAASGSAVTINLSTISTGLVSPDFVASVVGSVSFGSTELSKVFVISTTNLNHTAPAYEAFTISGQDASGPGASRVSSGVLNVLSQNVSSDHRFVITPSPQSVIEGDSVTLTVSRVASGSAVTINLSIVSAGLVNPDFAASVVGSVSFGSTELSKVFVVNTTNLNHTAPAYELFTISGQDVAGPGVSRVSSSMLNVFSQDVSSDRRFVITPALQSVIEGGSVTFTISRVASGSAITINLSTTSAGLVSPDFIASVAGGSVSFGSTELSKVFTVNTTNLNHVASQYELFTISGQDALGLGVSSVSSGVLDVLAYNQITMTASNGTLTGTNIGVIEGHAVTVTLTSFRQISLSDGNVVLNIASGVNSTNPAVLPSPITLTIGTIKSSFSKILSLSNTVGEDEILVVNAVDPANVYTINPVTITVQAYPIVIVSGSITGCYGTIADLRSVISIRIHFTIRVGA
jgi:hypothetical protein